MAKNVNGKAVEVQNPFEPDVVHEFLKDVWSREPNGGFLKATAEGEGRATEIGPAAEVAPESSKRSRTASANPNALKLMCELMRIFVKETVRRAAFLADIEGSTEIDSIHFREVAEQILQDF